MWRDWLLVAFAAAGVAMILHYESRGESLEAVFWGLASGVFYAGVVLSLRQLRDMESAWIVALNHLVTAIVLAPFAFSGGAFSQRHAVAAVGRVWAWCRWACPMCCSPAG